VACRTVAAKGTLYRIVRSPAGTVAFDPTGKAPGRGAYLCGRPACLESAARRRGVARALRVSDTAAVAAALEAVRTASRSEAAGLRAAREPREEVRTG
jgi:predicted RNA-binding protein YlxR (DUF448 family)